MNEYNTAFFTLYENWYKQIKSEFGEEKAVDLFRKVMETGLEKAYGNTFEKGKPSEFVKLIGERDKNVGLRISFPEVSNKKIIYRFHTDPFPNLKNHISHEMLDDTYIAFKIKHLLGEKWGYQNTAHIWDGHDYTEFTIFKCVNE